MYTLNRTSIVFIGVIFFLHLSHVVAVYCDLPNYLKNSRWNDTETDTSLTFRTTTMKGWKLTIQGTPLVAFTCIINSGNVFVFRSDGEFFDMYENVNKRAYLCMRITKVTDSLIYFYILSDEDTNVIPHQRVYLSMSEFKVTDTACSFCKYSKKPADSEYHLLRKENTTESLSTKPRLCLPCNATSCQSDDKETGANQQSTTTIIIVICVIVVVLVIIVIVVILVIKRRKTQDYRTAASKDTEMIN